jgi:hypothetical protein
LYRFDINISIKTNDLNLRLIDCALIAPEPCGQLKGDSLGHIQRQGPCVDQQMPKGSRIGLQPAIQYDPSAKPRVATIEGHAL